MQRLLLALLLCPLTVAAQSTLNDLDGDGCVGAYDILVILGQYGECNDTTAAFACGDSVLFDSYWYETVLIGDQCWFAENLRTTVYANGDLIPAGLTDEEWTSTTAGAATVYGEGSSDCYNDSPDIDACDEVQSLAAYGRLYNWYAVDDARGLCPSGWHVPTDEEWMVLEMELGMSESEAIVDGLRGTNQGAQLKGTSSWYNNGNGTDDFGFSALPGGYRFWDTGTSSGGGVYGRWWSSTAVEALPFLARLRGLNAEVTTVYRVALFKEHGYSVRCLRD